MVKLVPMTPDFYPIFMEQAVADFAADKVRSGNWPAEGALERSRQVFQQFLPQGLDTPEQHLYTITADEDGTELGYLWYGITGEGGQRAAYLYEFLIDEKQRRRGYGLQALQALDEVVRRAGLERILLHVFGHNQAAQALYAKAGYTVSNITMVRQL